MDEPEDAERPPAARYGRKRGLLTKSRSNGLDDLPGPFDALAEEVRSSSTFYDARTV